MPHPCTDPLTVQLVFDLWEKTGNVAESARQLGLNRFTCYAWIRRKDQPRKQRTEHPGKQRYLQLWAEGVPRRRAAADVGIGLTAAGEWDLGIRRVKMDERRVRLSASQADQIPVQIPVRLWTPSPGWARPKGSEAATAQAPRASPRRAPGSEGKLGLASKAAHSETPVDCTSGSGLPPCAVACADGLVYASGGNDAG
jgi:hypothetical protein